MEWKRLLLNGTRSLHREPLFRPHPFRPYPNPWWGLLSLFPDSNRNIHRPLDWKSRWKGDYRLFMNSSIQVAAVKSSLLVKSSFQPQIIESKWYNTAIFRTKSMTMICQFSWIDPKKAYKSVIKLLCFLIYKCMYLHNVSWNGKLPISFIQGLKKEFGWLDFHFFDRKIKIQKFLFLKTIQVSTKIRYR